MSTQINVTRGGDDLVQQSKAATTANRFAALQKTEEKALNRKVEETAAARPQEEIQVLGGRKENDLSARRFPGEMGFLLVDGGGDQRASGTSRVAQTFTKITDVLYLDGSNYRWVKEDVQYDLLQTQYMTASNGVSNFYSPGTAQLKAEFDKAQNPNAPAFEDYNAQKIGFCCRTTSTTEQINRWQIEWSDATRSIIRRIRYRHEDALECSRNPSIYNKAFITYIYLYIKCREAVWMRTRIAERHNNQYLGSVGLFAINADNSSSVYITNEYDGPRYYETARKQGPYNLPYASGNNLVYNSIAGTFSAPDPGRNFIAPEYRISAPFHDAATEGSPWGNTETNQEYFYPQTSGGCGAYPMWQYLLHDPYEPRKIVWSPDPQEEIPQKYYNQNKLEEGFLREDWTAEKNILSTVSPVYPTVTYDTFGSLYPVEYISNQSTVDYVTALHQKKSSSIGTIYLAKGINEIKVVLVDSRTAFGAEFEMSFDFGPFPSMLRPSIPAAFYPS